MSTVLKRKVSVLGIAAVLIMLTVVVTGVARLGTAEASDPDNWYTHYASGQYDCAPWYQFQYFDTRDAAVQYLENFGYHQTAGYAQLYGTNDYTSPITTSLGYGQYRYQARILTEGSGYRVYVNGPEPNPEFHTYWPPSPIFDWYNFVELYHNVVC